MSVALVYPRDAFEEGPAKSLQEGAIIATYIPIEQFAV